VRNPIRGVTASDDIGAFCCTRYAIQGSALERTEQWYEGPTFTLPVLLLGWGCLPLFARFCGVYLCMGLTAGVMGVAYVALYLAFGMISPKFARKILPKG